MKEAFENLKLDSSQNNMIIIRTRWGAIYLDKVLKVDQDTLSNNSFENSKIYILKLKKGEETKTVLISFASENLYSREIKPLLVCDKEFYFKELGSFDFQKVFDQVF